MQYRAVRLVASYQDEGSKNAEVNASLEEWANAGWTLHSQSMTTFISGGVAMSTSAASTHEIVLLIFQRESKEP